MTRQGQVPRRRIPGLEWEWVLPTVAQMARDCPATQNVQGLYSIYKPLPLLIRRTETRVYEHRYEERTGSSEMLTADDEEEVACHERRKLADPTEE